MFEMTTDYGTLYIHTCPAFLHTMFTAGVTVLHRTGI